MNKKYIKFCLGEVYPYPYNEAHYLIIGNKKYFKNKNHFRKYLTKNDLKFNDEINEIYLQVVKKGNGKMFNYIDIIQPDYFKNLSKWYVVKSDSSIDDYVIKYIWLNSKTYDKLEVLA